ncbi:MarR family transcriptional regulator [Bacillus massiliigorillae]|uniref:MarR family transcriptional regulator n=1 Tax=Bacillus massiliigorillae TaxID=1243664 RepID=UPI0003A0C360|nr:MarR family transcriptional regulator [Bacillus massiliigorillae]
MDRNKELFEVTSMFQTFMKTISRDFNKKSTSLNINQFKVLFIIDNSGSQTVSKLASALSISAAAVTGITDQLLSEGFVEKERCDNDRRIVNITITEKGKEKVNHLRAIKKEILQSYFDILPDEEIHHLKRIFTMLTTNL